LTLILLSQRKIVQYWATNTTDFIILFWVVHCSFFLSEVFSCALHTGKNPSVNFGGYFPLATLKIFWILPTSLQIMSCQVSQGSTLTCWMDMLPLSWEDTWYIICRLILMSKGEYGVCNLRFIAYSVSFHDGPLMAWILIVSSIQLS